MNDPADFAARSDGQTVEPEADARPAVLAHSRPPENMAADKVRCEACPVLCQISRASSAPATATATSTAS